MTKVTPKIFSSLMFVLLLALLIMGFFLKDNMNNYLSKTIQKQASPEIIISGNALIDSLYNYSTNGLSYEITFLEFGATGCSACKNMEKVMEEIKSIYTTQVNVVFLNILQPENRDLMKLYGIASIPTQVLLDNTGKEFFKHTGYISSEELRSKLSFELE